MIVLLGGVLVVVGLVTSWGGMSGRMASMLAAVFQPSALGGLATPAVNQPGIPNQPGSIYDPALPQQNPGPGTLGHTFAPGFTGIPGADQNALPSASFDPGTAGTAGSLYNPGGSQPSGGIPGFNGIPGAG